MHIFSDEDFRFERIWRPDNSGTDLQIQHIPTGEKEELFIGFDDESIHRRQLQNRLLERLAIKYPPDDIIIDHLYCGPGRGAALRIRHLPSGVAVERYVGYDPVGPHQRELLSELFRLLRVRDEG